jgi:phosphatidylinositol alpha-1,6-mannosyltransferase
VRPRLLVVTPDLLPSPGGIQLLLSRLVEHLGAFDVRVVARDVPGARDYDRAHGWSVLRVRAPGGSPKAALVSLNAAAAAELRRFRPHVVLAGHVMATPATWSARVPTVVYLHADEVPAHARVSRAALRRATYAIAVSRHTAALGVAHGADPERIRLIAPGVDLPAQLGPRERFAEPTIVTVARLEDRYKGHDVVMQAMLAVRERVPDARWVIVGDGSLRPELEALAARLGLGDAVRFTGRVDDAERDDWLARSHAFVMPSRVPPSGGGEGFGIVYLEAGSRTSRRTSAGRSTPSTTAAPACWWTPRARARWPTRSPGCSPTTPVRPRSAPPACNGRSVTPGRRSPVRSRPCCSPRRDGCRSRS